MIPKLSVKRPFTVLVAVVLIIVLGVVSYINMTPDLLPSIELPYVVVVTTYAGATPEEVEADLTKPVEQAMATLNSIKHISSTSSENVSIIMMEFSDSADMDSITVDIREALGKIESSMPSGAGSPYILKINPNMIPVEVVSVGMEGYEREELSDFVENTLLAKLQGIEGVAAVSTNGIVKRQINVVLSIEKLNALSAKFYTDLSARIDMEIISKMLEAQNFSMPAGYVAEDGVKWLVRVGEKVEDIEELENLLLFDVGLPGYDPVRLKDVADIFVTDNASEMYAKLNGLDGVLLSFSRQSTYDTATVSDNINAAFREFESEYDGLTFTALMDQGEYIYTLMGSVLENLALGAVLAILILFLFLRDLRPTFVVACSIPISLTFAVVLMYFSGVTLNVISLSGLAVGVGMLVDNSIVVIENIYRLRSEGCPAVRAAVSGAKEVAGAITASTLTTVCVFFPIVFVEGLTRQLFTDMALTIAYSLLASLAVALTLVPAMSSGLMRKSARKENKVYTKLLSVYEKSVNWSLAHRALTLILAAALLAGSTILAFTRGFTYMPEGTSKQVMISVELQPDSSLSDTVAVCDEAAAQILELEEVETVGAMLSSGMASVIGMSSNSMRGANEVTMYAILTDAAVKRSMDVSNKISEIFENMGCKATVSGMSSMTNYMTSIGGSGIEIDVYGEDLDSLITSAKAIADALEEIEGLTDISDGMDNASPELRITVNKDAAMARGLTVAQVYLALVEKMNVSKNSVMLAYEGGSAQVTVSSAAQPPSLGEIGDIEFTTTSLLGVESTFRLSDIAEITQTQAPNSISRSEQRRYISVTAALEDGYNVTLVNADAEKAVEKLNFSAGITFDFAGESETIMGAMGDLGIMLLLGVLIVYLIMVAQFQSLISPFIVMLTVPLAFTGGMLALLIAGYEVSVVSMIGFIMLVGVIVNNGIVLIDYIIRLRKTGLPRREAIVSAGRTRLRPVLMTALTTILGLMPMVAGLGMGSDMVQPVAVVCVGGLAYATFMTLYVVPVMYDIINKKPPRNVDAEVDAL